MKMAETTFFDVPLDLRKVIYRKARFLAAREKLKEKLLEHHKNHIVIKTRYANYRRIMLPPTKIMTIEHNSASLPNYADFLTVEIQDFSSVKVSLFVGEEKGKLITLRIYTELCIRNTSCRMPTIYTPISKWHKPLITWYEYGEFRYNMFENFSII